MAITRTTVTDDSGTGTDGTIANQTWLTIFYDTLDARWSEVSTTSVGNQNNFDFSQADTIRCNNATLLTLRGLLAPASPAKPGKRLIIVSVGGGQVDLANQDVNSTAANRIITGITGTISLAAGVGRAILEYDDTTDRWRVVEHEQGAWISPTFAAGDFTANGAMTWTLAAGDVTSMAYYLKGRTLFVAWYLTTTTVGGTLNTALRIGNGQFGGLTVAKQVSPGVHQYNDNGAGWVLGPVYAPAAATYLELYTAGFGSANWTASTNATQSSGAVALEVQ